MSERPSVVLIPSQLQNAETWAPQIAALGDDYDFRVADNTRDDTIAGIASRLRADSAPTFDLIAHGMGGFVALEVMRQAPERVRSLMLMSTLAPNDGPAQTERRQGYIKLVEDGNFAGVIEERIPILVHAARREDEPLLAVLRRMAEDTGPETFLRQQRAIVARIDSRPSLAAITCPVLLVRGAECGITTQAHQDEILAAVPQARLETIANSGHMVTLEMPRTMNRLLMEWLAR